MVGELMLAHRFCVCHPQTGLLLLDEVKLRGSEDLEPGDQSEMDWTYLPANQFQGRDRTPDRNTHESLSRVDTQASYSDSNPCVFWLCACGNMTAPSLSSCIGAHAIVLQLCHLSLLRIRCWMLLCLGLQLEFHLPSSQSLSEAA